MRNFSIFRFLFVLVIAVVAFGFWRGWFAFTTGNDPNDKKVDVRLTVDKDKIKHDVERAKDVAKEEKDKLTEPAHKLPENPRP